MKSQQSAGSRRPGVNVAGSASRQRESERDKANDKKITLNSPAAAIRSARRQNSREPPLYSGGWSTSAVQTTDGSAQPAGGERRG